MPRNAAPVSTRVGSSSTGDSRNGCSGARRWKAEAIAPQLSRRGRHGGPAARVVECDERTRELGIEVVLASSSKPHELERYLDLLDARRLGLRWASSDDVEATKPAPDLIERALAEVEGADALMLGDATWDVASAARAGI